VYAGVTGTTEVPDPYYGSADGFETVMRLCEAGALGVIERLAAPDAAASLRPEG